MIDLQEELNERYSAGVQSHALQTKARRDGDEQSFKVIGRDGETVYRQQVIESPRGLWITCTCPNGTRKGGQATCYHSAAALTRWHLEQRAAEFEQYQAEQLEQGRIVDDITTAQELEGEGDDGDD